MLLRRHLPAWCDRNRSAEHDSDGVTKHDRYRSRKCEHMIANVYGCHGARALQNAAELSSASSRMSHRADADSALLRKHWGYAIDHHCCPTVPGHRRTLISLKPIRWTDLEFWRWRFNHNLRSKNRRPGVCRTRGYGCNDLGAAARSAQITPITELWTEPHHHTPNDINTISFPF